MMDLKNRNLYNKRIFGRDITNIQKIEKRGKNFSISEKPGSSVSTTNLDQRLKSRSVSYKPLAEYKDVIVQYEKDIIDHMCAMSKLQSKQVYKYINDDMRIVLIDWMIQVHESFQLKQQTLYLALAYLNAFSGKVDITKHQYQLVGITCLWIASKYEEIYPPKMHNYVDVTDNSYTLHELKDMEGRIIQALGFNLTFTTSLNILQALSDKWMKQRNLKKQLVLTRDSMKVLHMCKFLLELSIISNFGKDFTINTLVLSAITLSDSIFKTKSQVKLLQESDKPDKQTLMKCFKEMCNILQDCHNNKKYNAVIKKFQKDKYSKVSKIKISQK